MKQLSISRVMTNGFLALVFGVLAAVILPVSPLLAAGVLFGVGTGGQILAGAQNFNGVVSMALQTEVWVSDIQEQLFFENEFINLAVDHSSYVSNLTVHVPQAGAVPTVVKNRTAIETTPVQRADTDLTYSLDNYTTDPIVVKNLEGIQVAYDKRASVLSSHIAALNEKIAMETLWSWAVTGAASAVLETSGTGAAGLTLPHATATGTRLALTVDDLARVAATMDLQKVPKQGRFIVIPTCMFYGLFSDTQLLQAKASLGEDIQKMGVIMQLFTLNIIVRGEVVRYTNAATPTLRLQTAAEAATDCAGAVAFSRFFVSQALGSILVYLNEGVAKSYGDVMSAEVNHGAAKLRTDAKGIVCIRQGYVAP
jgi:hypothetical protein